MSASTTTTDARPAAVPSRGQTPSAVARFLGVGAHKVHRWIERGELRAVNIADSAAGKPQWVILPDQLTAFIVARSSTPTPPPTSRRRASSGRKSCRAYV